MQSLGRATIIGENTRGGAHDSILIPFPEENITLQIPIKEAVDPRTKSNWEGVGIKPDIPVPASKAFQTAVREAAKEQQQLASVEDGSLMTPTHDELGDRWLAVHRDDTVFTRGKWYRYAAGIWTPTDAVPREVWLELVDAKPDAVEFYRHYGFVVIDALEGLQRSVPHPIPMYLPLGAVPVSNSSVPNLGLVEQERAS